VGEAAVMAAGNPAAVLSLDDRGRLELRARADLIVLSRGLQLKAVFLAGRELA
jgi:N-acetylglucosamine-6-phosphate deacetylase